MNNIQFKKILGQQRSKSILIKAIENNRISHAYLFSGPEGIGKEAMAFEFAKVLYCTDPFENPCGTCSSCKRISQFNHPDIIFIFPAPKAATVEEEREILDSFTKQPYARLKPWANPVISIDRIRELRKTCTIKPMEGKRIIIIAEADKMTIEAANSLLKILEEPPKSTHIILTSSQYNSLLPTIISRCQELRFGILSDELVEQALVDQYQVETEQARLVSKICQGNFRRAIEWLENDLTTRRDDAVEFLRTCLKNDYSRHEMVEKILDKYDKAEIKDILNLIILWFRDSLVLFHENSYTNSLDNKIINRDKFDVLRKFTNAFSHIEFNLIFNEIERAIELINYNVQVNLVLIVLMAKIKQALKVKGAAA